MAEQKNLPINPERRDPYQSKNKGDVGLSKTPNMSYTELQNSILANVVSQVNEGTIYNFPKRTAGVNLLSNIVKLKPSTSCATILFSLGTWNGASEFIGLDTARLDLIVSGDNGSVINYKLTVSNNSLGHTRNVLEGDDCHTATNKNLGDVDNYEGHNYVTWNKNGVYTDKIEDGTDSTTKNADGSLKYPQYRGRTAIKGRGWYPSGDPSKDAIIERKSHTTASTILSSVKVVLKNFTEGGWLVSLDIPGVGLPKDIDAIWINLLGCRNIDPQLPTEEQYTDNNFVTNNKIVILCDKSKDSSNILFENDVEGLISYSRSLNHDIKIHFDCVDPLDTYNTEMKKDKSSNHSWSNTDPTSGTNVDSEIIPSINVKTNEIECFSPQNFPLTINRLNHPVKFRLFGPSLHYGQESTWKGAWDGVYKSGANTINDPDEYQLNLKSTIDTARGVENSYPIGISGMTHDLDVSMGVGKYEGSIPESNSSKNFTTQSFKDPDATNKYKGDYCAAIFDEANKTVNYATISASSSAFDNHYEFNENTHEWELKNNPNGWKAKDKVLSIDTRLDSDDTIIPTSNLNLIIHGIDHDLLLEAVNSNYRNSRGIATKTAAEVEGFDFEPDKKYGAIDTDPILTSGISNLTWNVGSESEERRYSYSTGNIKINTFEKRNYQTFDLVNHGLDHNIKFKSYRDSFSDTLKDPDTSKADNLTNQYRLNSNGQDILGTVNLDTFTNRVQRTQLRVIDGRYTDSSRGLAITKVDDKGKSFIPHDSIINDGSYGTKTTNLVYSELSKFYPTINGVPFTGDFRHTVPYTDLAGPHTVNNESGNPKDRTVVNENLRNIDIFAFHSGDTVDKSGDHKWETLSTLRKAESAVVTASGINTYSPNSVIKTRTQASALDSSGTITTATNSYGLVRLNKFTDKVLTKEPSMPYVDDKGDYNTGAKDESHMNEANLMEFLNNMGSGAGSTGGNDDDVVTVRSLKRVIGAIIGGKNFYKSIDNANDVNKEYGIINAGPGTVPIGTIVPWYNKEWYDQYEKDHEIPLPDYLTKRGWILCDGREHPVDSKTYIGPDLTGRYIRGWDPTYTTANSKISLGAGHSKGGIVYTDVRNGITERENIYRLKESTIPEHSHKVIPSEDSIKSDVKSVPHNHAIAVYTRKGHDKSSNYNYMSYRFGYKSDGTTVDNTELNKYSPGDGEARYTSITDSSSVQRPSGGSSSGYLGNDSPRTTSHFHTLDLKNKLTTSIVGSTETFNIEPFYFKLIYIIKVK